MDKKRFEQLYEQNEQAFQMLRAQGGLARFYFVNAVLHDGREDVFEGTLPEAEKFFLDKYVCDYCKEDMKEYNWGPFGSGCGCEWYILAELI
jgi:hypothetical protein